MFVVMRYTKEYKEKHSRNFTFIDWKCPCGEISTMRFNTSNLNKGNGVTRCTMCEDCNKKSIYKSFRNTGKVIIKYTSRY
jgi:hypothetical protein